ncbi:MAG: hypothetical protein ABIO72_00580 [Patescibacteria group bacterium]
MANMEMTHDCPQGGATCPTAAADHMTTFASMFPSIPTDVSGLLLLVVVAVIAWVSIWKRYIFTTERLNAETKDLIRRFAYPTRPRVLVFAFSQGILHPKRHA